MRIAYLVAIPLLIAYASSVPAADDLMAEVDGANQAFAQAILDKDIDHLVGDYTDDACVLAPSAPRVCGLDAIRDFWTGVADSDPRDVQLETLSVGSSGELAYATGVLRITGADGSKSAFNYVLVFKNVDDVWKLHLDTWTPRAET